MKKSLFRHAAALLAACLVSQSAPGVFAAADIPAAAPDPLDLISAEQSTQENVSDAGQEMLPAAEVPDFTEAAEGGQKSVSSQSEVRVSAISAESLGSTFTIVAENIPDDISELTAEVSREGQEDAPVRYPMHLDDIWTAEASISDFHCGYGWYAVRVVSPAPDGSEYVWGSASHLVGAAGTPDVAAAPADEGQTRYRLTLTGAELPGNPAVWFEVRSRRNSADRSAAYRAYLSKGEYVAFVRIPDHAQCGTYEYVVKCGEYPDHGNLICSGTFEVDGVTSADAVFENVDRSAGTFRIRAHAQAPAGIKCMLVTVWSENDRSDSRVTLMKRNGDAWYADFSVLKDFKGHFGTYRARIYAQLKNGIGTLAAARNHQIEPENYVRSEKAEAGRYLVHVVNPNPAQDVRVAVWSEEGGQDDIVWYAAETSQQGVYTAEVTTRRHRSSGIFHAHVYSGETLLGSSDFEVPEGEVPQFPEISDPPAKRESWYFMRNSSHQPPSGAWSAEELRPYDAYYLGDTSRKVIYLAFDTGYDNGNTERILDTLKANGVHAAFFVTKGFLDSCPELAVRMAEEGHVVGNHTVTHPDMSKLSAAQISAELDGCADRYREITGRDMDPFLRPPEGVFSGQSMLRSRDLGYTTIFWSLAYQDWDVSAQPSVSSAYSKIVNYVHPGCITLIHTVSSANAGALDSALKTLISDGYEFDSLYDLP